MGCSKTKKNLCNSYADGIGRPYADGNALGIGGCVCRRLGPRRRVELGALRGNHVAQVCRRANPRHRADDTPTAWPSAYGAAPSSRRPGPRWAPRRHVPTVFCYADGHVASPEDDLCRRATPTAALGIAYAEGQGAFADGRVPSA